MGSEGTDVDVASTT